MQNNTTVDAVEVNKFAQHAGDWWDKEGPLKTLHDLNPLRLAFIQQHLALSEQRVLDVGCGGGILSEALAGAGAVVTGLDVEVNALNAARAHAQGVSINYVCQPIELYVDTPFDAVVCMELLEHVAHPAGVIEHIARLVRPGGHVFLSTINRTLKAYTLAILAAEYCLGLLPRQTHDYAKFIRPSELGVWLRAYGFEVLDLVGVAYNPWSRIATRCESVDVNYLLVARRQS